MLWSFESGFPAAATATGEAEIFSPTAGPEGGAGGGAKEEPSYVATCPQKEDWWLQTGGNVPELEGELDSNWYNVCAELYQCVVAAPFPVEVLTD